MTTRLLKRKRSATDRTIIGMDVTTNRPVAVSERARFEGMSLVGLQGMGKTTLLEYMIDQDIQAGYGLCVIDPHRDFGRSIIARVPEHRASDLIVLDLKDWQHPFGLNLFSGIDPHDHEAVDEGIERVLQIIERMFGDLSDKPQMVEVFSYAMQTCIYAGLTFAEIRPLLRRPDFRSHVLAKLDPVEHADLLEFWDEYKKGKDQSTQNKLSQFVGRRLRVNIFGQPQTVDFSEAMNTNKIIVVLLAPKRKLDNRLVGGVILSRLLEAALGREAVAESERVPFHLYADEYGSYATPAVSEMVEQVRKFKLAVTIAHQKLSQLDADQRSLPFSMLNKIVFQVNSEDAAAFSTAFADDPVPPVEVEQKVTRPIREKKRLEIWEPPSYQEYYQQAQRAYHRYGRTKDYVAMELYGQHRRVVEQIGEIIYENKRPLEEVRYVRVAEERSPSQIRHNIRDTLRDLSPLTARVRLRSVSGTKETTISIQRAPAIEPSVVEQRIKAAYALTHRVFTKPRHVVEAEIRARQTVQLQTEPAAKPPTRLHPMSTPPPEFRQLADDEPEEWGELSS